MLGESSAPRHTSPPISSVSDSSPSNTKFSGGHFSGIEQTAEASNPMLSNGSTSLNTGENTRCESKTVDQNIVKLAVGGKLWVMGGNDRGQCGLPPGTSPAEGVSTVDIQERPPISALACGANHTVVCTTAWGVYSTGDNSSGQLCNGSVDPPAQLGLRRAGALHLPVVSVACGRAHTLLVTVYGELLSCGSNSSGQLGLGDFLDRAEPTRSDVRTD